MTVNDILALVAVSSVTAFGILCLLSFISIPKLLFKNEIEKMKNKIEKLERDIKELKLK